jgi:hypothetical protein
MQDRLLRKMVSSLNNEERYKRGALKACQQRTSVACQGPRALLCTSKMVNATPKVRLKDHPEGLDRQSLGVRPSCPLVVLGTCQAE